MSKPKKKFGGLDAGAKRYYDPGAKPYPSKPIITAAPILGPVQNTRHARRARARLPFIEQRGLANKMGFAVPPDLQLTEETGAAFWISTWEELYTKANGVPLNGSRLDMRVAEDGDVFDAIKEKVERLAQQKALAEGMSIEEARAAIGSVITDG